MRAIVIAARSRIANTIPAIAADRRVRQKPAVRTGAPAVISRNFLGTHVRMSDQGKQPTTASGAHRSERTEYRQVVEADYPHAGQASWRSSSLRSRRRTTASPDRQANVAPLERSSPAAGDAQRSTQPAQALLSLAAPVMCLLVVEPQISMGKVARTNRVGGGSWHPCVLECRA